MKSREWPYNLIEDIKDCRVTKVVEEIPGCVKIELVANKDKWNCKAKDWLGIKELPGFSTYKFEEERQKMIKKKPVIEIDLFEEIKKYLLGACGKMSIDDLRIRDGKLYADYGTYDLRVTYNLKDNKRYVKAFRLLKKLKRLMDETEVA